MKSPLVRGLAGLAALALAGCVDEYVDTEPKLSSFAVHLVDPSVAGSPEAPIPVPLGDYELRLEAQALGTDGRPFPWNGVARVKVTPGRTPSVRTDCPPERSFDACAIPDALDRIRFVDGVAKDVAVRISGVHSETAVWIVDDLGGGTSSGAVGLAPLFHFEAPTLAAINAIPPGKDTMTSWFIESGTRGDFVRMEREGFVFATREKPEDACTLADPGPTRRDLIVTAVTAQGFYVTDLSEPPNPSHPGNFGHLYVFNFSFPEGLQPGDRIYMLEGSIQEFGGHSQISFPVYRTSYCNLVEGDDEASVARVRAEQRALELEALAALEASAPVIDSSVCGTGIGALSCGHAAQNRDIESLESAVVVVPEVKTPEMWVRCDFDGDGDVVNPNQVGSTYACNFGNEENPECLCLAACLTSGVFPPPDSPLEASHADKAFDATGKVCSERTAYDAYGQYVVRIVEKGVPGPRIAISTRDAFPDFDPEAEENLGSHIRVRGNLLHVRAARPRWVVQARTPDERNDFDLCCLPGKDCPAGLQACR